MGLLSTSRSEIRSSIFPALGGCRFLSSEVAPRRRGLTDEGLENALNDWKQRSNKNGRTIEIQDKASSGFIHTRAEDWVTAPQDQAPKGDRKRGRQAEAGSNKTGPIPLPSAALSAVASSDGHREPAAELLLEQSPALEFLKDETGRLIY